MAAGKRSKSSEAYSARYKTSGFATNRKKKLERILKQQPNNEQVKMALKDIHYRRQAPKTRVWSASAKRVTNLISNWCKDPKSSPTDTIAAKHMFSLKTRITYKGQFLYTDSKKLTGLIS